MPPEPAGLVTSRQAPVAARGAWWREIPAWAEVAAALLCLGAAAGIANLDVRYDAGGLRVRTGWSGATAVAGGPGDAPWRAELTALEQRLRADARQPNPAATGVGVPATAGNVANPEGHEEHSQTAPGKDLGTRP